MSIVKKIFLKNPRFITLPDTYVYIRQIVTLEYADSHSANKNFLSKQAVS